MVQKLEQLHGFESLNCRTEDPEDLNDRSSRTNKRDVILLDPMPRKRGFALSAITQAPWGKAALILRLAAKTDPDPHVRQIAKEMLAGYAP